jgi:hypothetical protein
VGGLAKGFFSAFLLFPASPRLLTLSFSFTHPPFPLNPLLTVSLRAFAPAGRRENHLYQKLA